MNRWKKVIIAGTCAIGMLFSGAMISEAAPYTVKDNDTMYFIAKRNGIPLNTLIQFNRHVANPNIIWPGMVLNIPDGAPAAQPSNWQQPAQQTKADQYAAQVVDLVNQERANAGLKPLRYNGALSVVAMDKAKDMYHNKYFSHNSPTYGSPFDMMSKYGIRYSYAGENIAMGQRTPQEVMNAWMNSQGHRKNILNPNFTSIGVAYYNGEWVQQFIG